MTLTDVKDALTSVQERDEELSFRAGKTVDHLNHLNLPDMKAKQELFEKIQALDVPRLKPQHIHKIIDIRPASVKELAIILSGYTLTVNKDYQEKIIGALND